MKKLIATLLLFSTLFLLNAGNVSAETYVVEPSAQLKRENLVPGTDFRVVTLTTFFEKYDSPLAEYAEDFVGSADEYNLDWRLVPAISGVESTFGKRIPSGSYNAYGWANGTYYFDSWEDSIVEVSRALREKYYDRGATNIRKIARRYAPPSETWAGKVEYFMNKIDPIPLEFTI